MASVAAAAVAAGHVVTVVAHEGSEQPSSAPQVLIRTSLASSAEVISQIARSSSGPTVLYVARLLHYPYIMSHMHTVHQASKYLHFY